MIASAASASQFVHFAYFVLNIDPIFFQVGPLAVHWYGLAYVVAISIALLGATFPWAHKMGLHDDQVWNLFIWTAIAGLIGGRLYYVIQQPDLVQNFLLKPYNIIAVWNGGMAFFGAIFAGTATLFFIAPRYGLSRWLAIDAGAVFALVGQIFGRFGNVINGDILGQAVAPYVNVPAGVCASAPCLAYVPDTHFLSWAIVYMNPHSFAPNSVPFAPAPIYEMLCNIVALALLWPLRNKLPHLRAGLFFVCYVMLYAVGQFIVFFARGTEPNTPFLGIDGLKQAQWTAIFVFLAGIILFFVVRRFSAPWPYSDKYPLPWNTPAGRFNWTEPGDGNKAAMVAANGNQGSATRRTRTTAPATEPAANLPAWEPTRATGGRLRNIFSQPRDTTLADQS